MLQFKGGYFCTLQVKIVSFGLGCYIQVFIVKLKPVPPA